MGIYISINNNSETGWLFRRNSGLFTVRYFASFLPGLLFLVVLISGILVGRNLAMYFARRGVIVFRRCIVVRFLLRRWQGAFHGGSFP